MPGKRGSSLKDREMYEELREDGASKEKAARISNAAAAQGRSTVGGRGGSAEDYDDRTVPELKARAKELGLHGYSGKKKAELISLLRINRTIGSVLAEQGDQLRLLLPGVAVKKKAELISLLREH